MKRVTLFLCFIFLSFSSFSKELKLVADLYCPWSCNPHGEDKGLIVDLTKDIYEAAGYTVTYKTESWTDCIAKTKNGEYDALAGALKDDVDATWGVPDKAQGAIQDAIYVLQDSKFKYTDYNSLKALKKLSFNDGYAYVSALEKFKKEFPGQIFLNKSDKPLLKNIKLLQNKVISAFVEDPAVYKYTTKTSKMKVSDVRSAGIIKSAPLLLFVVYSPKNKKKQMEHVKIMNEGMKDYIAKGKLEALIKKYNVDKWY